MCYLDRLENEHLGNMDQYRVTREVPLPYSFDDVHTANAEEEDEDESLVALAAAARAARSKARAGMRKMAGCEKSEKADD
ncbi:hypothetical protein H0H81_007245 [Sphagnurus paluster]|uniref:Uncharacterized protein n=1 Tax=Sphagnurus paluster TaxID=117069 RepID=A0A9P7KJB4_9AGAR|nr:hypothetical protein H0H81_007245 [Sphagnurus paluster]